MNFLKKMLLFLFLQKITLLAQTPQLPLQKAIEQKIIEIDCKGNDKSTHYLKPILMTIKNLKDIGQSVLIEAGTYFSSQPAEYQDIVIVETIVITLNSKEKKELALNGVCSEANLSSPQANVKYIMATPPKSDYVKYAQFINENKLFSTYEAQRGMWSISNGYDWCIDGNSDEKGMIAGKITYFLGKLKNIPTPWLMPDGSFIEKEVDFKVLENGKPILKKHKITRRNPMPQMVILAEKEYDVVKNGKKTRIKHYSTRENLEPDSMIIEEKEFDMVENGKRFKKKHFVTKESPKPLGEIVYGQKDYKVKKNGNVYSNYTRLITNQNPEPMCEMWGNGRFHIQKKSNVRVAMFDVNNILVREIYYNPDEKAGTHTIEYAYDCDVYQDKIYYFKIIKDDVVTSSVRLAKK